MPMLTVRSSSAAIRLRIRSAGTEAASAEKSLAEALDDPAPNVRMAAADALVSVGSRVAVMPVLIDGVRHESEWIRLRALNVLDTIGDRARPAVPEIKKARKSKSRWGYDHRAMDQLVEKFEGR